MDHNPDFPGYGISQQRIPAGLEQQQQQQQQQQQASAISQQHMSFNQHGAIPSPTGYHVQQQQPGHLPQQTPVYQTPSQLDQVHQLQRPQQQLYQQHQHPQQQQRQPHMAVASPYYPAQKPSGMYNSQPTNRAPQTHNAQTSLQPGLEMPMAIATNNTQAAPPTGVPIINPYVPSSHSPSAHQPSDYQAHLGRQSVASSPSSAIAATHPTSAAAMSQVLYQQHASTSAPRIQSQTQPQQSVLQRTPVSAIPPATPLHLQSQKQVHPQSHAPMQPPPHPQSRHNSGPQQPLPTPQSIAAQEAASSSTAEAMELEQARVSLVLHINGTLIQDLVKMQDTGKSGAPPTQYGQQPQPQSQPQTPQNPDGTNQDGSQPQDPSQPAVKKTPNAEYIECLRRLHSNLAYMSSLVDRSKKPGAAIVHPILAPPQLSPGYGEMYEQLSDLFPGVAAAQYAQIRSQRARQAQAAQAAQAQAQVQAQAQAKARSQAQEHPYDQQISTPTGIVPPSVQPSHPISHSSSLSQSSPQIHASPHQHVSAQQRQQLPVTSHHQQQQQQQQRQPQQQQQPPSRAHHRDFSQQMHPSQLPMQMPMSMPLSMPMQQMQNQMSMPMQMQMQMQMQMPLPHQSQLPQQQQPFVPGQGQPFSMMPSTPLSVSQMQAGIPQQPGGMPNNNMFDPAVMSMQNMSPDQHDMAG